MKRKLSAKFGRGKTMVGALERVESASTRLKKHKKDKRRQIIVFGALVTLIIVVATSLVNNWQNWFNPAPEKNETEIVHKPSVKILDEGGAHKIPSRVSEYVGRLEQDFQALGLKVERAILPKGNSREIDIYLEGNPTFFKLNLDKDTAISAEDIARTCRYLEKQGIKPTYVDVRVKGKVFYK